MFEVQKRSICSKLETQLIFNLKNPDRIKSGISLGYRAELSSIKALGFAWIKRDSQALVAGAIDHQAPNFAKCGGILLLKRICVWIT